MDCFYCGSKTFGFGSLSVCSSCAKSYKDYSREELKQVERPKEEIKNGEGKESN